jgi:hypothetical protein
MLVPPKGDGTPRLLVPDRGRETNGEVSRDGRWLAYQADISGQYEIYVRQYLDLNSRGEKVSEGGGLEPLWSWNSRELFYRTPNGDVMRVAVPPGERWTSGRSERVIGGGAYLVSGGNLIQRTYDVSHDSSRFLLLKRETPTDKLNDALRIVVVNNWFKELEGRAPR